MRPVNRLTERLIQRSAEGAEQCPLVGSIILLVFLAGEGKPEGRRFDRKSCERRSPSWAAAGAPMSRPDVFSKRIIDK